MLKHLLLLLSLASPAFADCWLLDEIDESVIVHGVARKDSGVSNSCIVLNGESLLELKDSDSLTTNSTFTISLWFNPYDLNGGQQMLIGKNRYSRNERQWSVTIEPDGHLKAYLYQDGWSTISSSEPLNVGTWHRLVLVVDSTKATLFLNDKPTGEVQLKKQIKMTSAPITLGGIWDADQVRQPFLGAIDECLIENRVWSTHEIAESYQPIQAKHQIPKVEKLPLWNEAYAIPKASQLTQVANVDFHVIKKQRPDVDGCNFTLGVGLVWHKNRLYASYGFNRGVENTPTEEAHVRSSDDEGKTWSDPIVMDSGEGDLAVSHGVFLSHKDQLWAFMGAFYDHPKLYHRVHTRAYLLNETTGEWEQRGLVVSDGFWPMQEPQRMSDGNWIMSGFRVGGPDHPVANLPAVAISHGDDFTKWDLIVIPSAPELSKNIWGESTVIIEEKRILNIARYGSKAIALLSTSNDNGRTWTPITISNMPMATSKPYAGTLSNGQHYLVCTTTADTGGARTPLTIAVSKPNESLFSKVFLIRNSLSDHTPGVSAPNADFSYPYAVEHDGKLYIGYTHKSHIANELAVIPIRSLEILD